MYYFNKEMFKTPFSNPLFYTSQKMYQMYQMLFQSSCDSIFNHVK